MSNLCIFTLRTSIILYCLIYLGFSTSSAQSNYLSIAKQKSQDARQVYQGIAFSPDQPVWQETLAYLNLAIEAAPNNPEVLYFATIVYNEVGWYSRSWEFAQRYIQADEILDEAFIQSVADSGNNLGYSFYEMQDFPASLKYYRTVNSIAPNNINALRWIARIQNEAGNFEASLTAWQQLQELDPNDPSITYFLTYTEQQLYWGKEAGQLFMDGLGLYETGKVEEANQNFVQASQFNNTYLEAHRWAARTYQELGQNNLALSFWRAAQELAPDSEDIRYFIGVLSGEITPSSSE